MVVTIDLDQYRSEDSLVFAGRDRGAVVRKRARLDEIDRTGEDVLIIVPDDVYSVNSSFFLGMLGESIRKLGEEEFRRRFRFKGAIIEVVVDDAIREALRKGSPF